VTRLVAVLLLAAASCATALAQAHSVVAVTLTVADADRSAAFFHDVLQFERAGETEVADAAHEQLESVFGARIRTVTMRLGQESIRLQQFLAPEGAAVPPDGRGNDLWFQHVAIVVSDMRAAYARLREHGVRHISSGPQRLPDWNPNAGGIEAFYFKDPDGHALELIRFPAGKGDPRWQTSGGRLFLGIDHTAITVRDTDESLRFWRDRLGLHVAGTSENYGDEQAHLNGVFGARLRITGLRAAAGPGVELLEYLAPRDGRRRPASARANDLVAWQTEIGVQGIDAVVDALRGQWVSPGTVNLAGPAAPPERAALVSDPDGHVALLLEER
jgi:catechol 2,3-dioxygenase-like lactoylglutathione lyase family enzyme